MATVYVSMGQVGARGLREDVEVYAAGSLRSETITSSGTSAAGSLAAVARDMVQVFCATSVYVTLAPTPVAAAGNSILVPAGIPTHIAARVGDRVAVLDA
jgi:hypothetical protein